MRMLLATTLALLLLTGHRPASALSCPRILNPAEQVRRAEMVLVGRILTVEEPGTAMDPYPVAPALLQVERVYKGLPADWLTVQTVPVYNEPRPRPGERWLLYLNRSPQGHLQAGPCAPHRLLPEGQSLPFHQAWLLEGPAHALARTGPGRTMVLTLGLAAFALVRRTAGRRQSR